MSALNNSDYTSHSLHSWRNRSMWHWDAAAALVSFFGHLLWRIPFEGKKICLLDFFTQVFIKGPWAAQVKFDVMCSHTYNCNRTRKGLPQTRRRKKTIGYWREYANHKDTFDIGFVVIYCSINVTSVQMDLFCFCGWALLEKYKVVWLLVV